MSKYVTWASFEVNDVVNNQILLLTVMCTEREFCILFISRDVRYLLRNVVVAMSETSQKFATGLMSFTSTEPKLGVYMRMTGGELTQLRWMH